MIICAVFRPLFLDKDAQGDLAFLAGGGSIIPLPLQHIYCRPHSVFAAEICRALGDDFDEAEAVMVQPLANDLLQVAGLGSGTPGDKRSTCTFGQLYQVKGIVDIAVGKQ